MKITLKWILLVFFVFLTEELVAIDGISLNLSFLLIYLFVINHFFYKSERKKIAPSEFLPVIFFATIGLLEDLFQGIIGPAIISKTLTGVILMILVKQLFFHWTEFFKALVICFFTILDEAIYSFIVIYFFNYYVDPFFLVKSFIIKGLVNIPLGLISSWRKP